MKAVLVLVYLAVGAFARELPDFIITEIIDVPGKQYAWYKANTASLTLPDNANEDVHTGLNIVRDNELTKADLHLWYWHEHLKYGVERAFKMINDNRDNKITKDELKNDLAKKHFIVALTECKYLKSPGLRQNCYADQMLTYAGLVLGPNDITKFYRHLDKDNNGLTKEEILKLPNPKNKDLHILAEELGAHDDNRVSNEEFDDYVQQETLNDDFRICRKGAPDHKTGAIDFDEDCLTEELITFVNDDLTELDVSVLFRAVDTNGDKEITKQELEPALPQGTDVDKTMKLLDMSVTTLKGQKMVIDYGEFRTYMMSPTVVLQMERYCTEPKKTQVEEIKCIYELFVKLTSSGHAPIWMKLPDLEKHSSFETLDVNQNGHIDDGDLKTFTHEEHHFHDEHTRKRFLAEIDADKSTHASLEECNEYFGIPHMVYGVGECQLHTKTKPDTRKHCYVREIGGTIDNFKFWNKGAVEAWFRFYDTSTNRRIEASDLAGKVDEANRQNFLEELGQGGLTVEEFEFEWYIKQQDLADAYDEDPINIKSEIDTLTSDQLVHLHAKLLHYIENAFTQYDSQTFFAKLDEPHPDHELTRQDFTEKVWTKVEVLIKKIDKKHPEGDADEHVHYIEFWLWLNSENDGANKAQFKYIKNIFEHECTEPKKANEEIDCYVRIFKDASKFQ